MMSKVVFVVTCLHKFDFVTKHPSIYAMDFWQDVVVRVPLVNLEDVARIKDVLSVEGDYSRLQTKQSFELTILSSTFFYDAKWAR